MKHIFGLALFVLFLSLAAIGCEYLAGPVTETPDGYQVRKDTTLNVILQTELGSNINRRGDQFVTQLKEDLNLNGKVILPRNAQIRGLVKRVNKYERLGDRASLLLLFDQIVFPDGRQVPLGASLDTEMGNRVIKIEGRGVKNATIVGGSALVGALAGRKVLGEEKGGQKGLVVGAAAGAGAVILSTMREVRLPHGTELVIRLNEVLFIPK